MDALGLVETFGLVPAIEAADAAVKSADITLSGLTMIGAGLVTVKLRGDISAVKAGVEAAVTAARRLGEVRSDTVIGRTADGLSQIIDRSPPALPEPEEPPEGTPESSPDTPCPEAPDEPPAAADVETLEIPTGAALSRMRVLALRKLARSLAQENEGNFPLSPEKIKFARKKDLIRVIGSFIKTRK